MSYDLLKNKALPLDRRVIRPHNADVIWRVILTVIFVLSFAAQAFAQVSGKVRREEEGKRILLDAAPSREVGAFDAFSFETGGWVSYRFFHYENTDNDHDQAESLDSVYWTDVRLWERVVFQTPEMKEDKRQHFFYTRFKAAYIERNGEAPGAKYDLVGPLVDYAYASFDWRPWKLEAGRRYFNIGRGIAYGGINDGFQLNYLRPGWNLGLFASRSLPNEHNIDTSVPGYDRGTRRYFGGVGLGYAGIPDTQLYSFFVAQEDHSREKPEDEFQEYRYDSRYAGLGLKGKRGERWDYWLEGIREEGTSREYGTDVKSAIEAWAFDGEVNYATGWPSVTILSGQYSYGSGDPDRVSVTDTIDGNLEGNDRNFLHFGYFRSSAALAPNLSNLHMARLGVEAQPFYRWRFFKKMTWGVDHYRFWKDEPWGGISDIDATEPEREVGYETDLRVSWRIAPRVLWALEYGVFTPGKAYASSAQAKEKAFSTSLTIFF
jgi:hypothetical protein